MKLAMTDQQPDRKDKKEAQLLRRVMGNWDLAPKQFAEQAGISAMMLSRVRNGVQVSQTNWISVVKALPQEARAEYLRLVFDLDYTSGSYIRIVKLAADYYVGYCDDLKDFKADGSSPRMVFKTIEQEIENRSHQN